MRVAVLQENLARGLNIVNRAISSRSMLTVLSNILLETDHQRLKLVASSLDITIIAWIGASVEEEGATTVPGKNLYDLVNNLSPERVDMELNSRTQTLRLKCGSNVGQFRCIDAAEFPLVPEVMDDAGASIPADVFSEMVTHVSFAAAKDDNRPVLTGILLKLEGHKITMVSADGYRLAIRTAELLEPVDQTYQLIVPARMLVEVSRIVGLLDNADTVRIALPEGRNQALFEIGGSVQVFANLLDGAFPDYEAILPRKPSTTSQIYTKELLRACKRSEVFAKDAADSALLLINPVDTGVGSIKIVSRSQELGENEGIIDASIDGEAIEISFNIKFLIDVLNVIKEDQVYLQTNGLSAPGIIKPVGRDDFMHIIMPMSPTH